MAGPNEAIRGELTLTELAAKHGIHHRMIGAWIPPAMRILQAVQGVLAIASNVWPKETGCPAPAYIDRRRYGGDRVMLE